MKSAIVAIGISLLILTNSSCAQLSYGKVSFKKYSFDVELARTADERARGLMFRDNLAPDKGMLFIYEEEGECYIWMKNTLIPLDIIWINEDKRVVFIGRDIPPCRAMPCSIMNPDVEAKYVLELNANTAQDIGLNVGDKLEFDIF